LPVQRCGVSLRRVLYIERLEYAEESGQPRKTLAADRRQLHGSPVADGSTPQGNAESTQE
jgi:hypothetical protein